MSHCFLLWCYCTNNLILKIVSWKVITRYHTNYLKVISCHKENQIIKSQTYFCIIQKSSCHAYLFFYRKREDPNGLENLQKHHETVSKKFLVTKFAPNNDVVALTPAKLMHLLYISNKFLKYRQKAPSSGSKVTCMPLGFCSCIYGTSPSHFEEYGFVSPEEASCTSQNGMVLCIENSASCLQNPMIYSTTTKPEISQGRWIF